MQRLDQRPGQGFVFGHVHVQRAVGLDVLQLDAGQRGQFAQRAELVEHVVDQLVNADIHVAAAKAHQVPEAGVGTDANALRRGHLDRAAHGAGVAGMEAGGHIGRADQRHQLRIHAITNGPGAEAFAHVGVEIDLRFLHWVAPLSGSNEPEIRAK